MKIIEGSPTSEHTISINLSYGTLVTFSQYWTGQNDPLYAILSRRGDSVDWVNLKASQEEIDRLKEVAEEILSRDDVPIQHTWAAKVFVLWE